MDSPNDRTLDGATLKTIREACGLTQKDLAELCGVHRLTVVRWESGKRPIPRRSRFQILDIIFRHKK